MAYRADVAFLESCSPELIERNAAEFGRIRDLLDSVEPLVTKAGTETIWESDHRHHYDARLADVRGLVTGLSAGFDRARRALLGYADDVERAKQCLRAGIEAESRLDQLVSSVASAIRFTARRAEPMRRWEDIRQSTGVLDSIAELGMAVDRIRDQAERAYDEAGDAFGRAQSIEREAREHCLVELRRAYDGLPEFRRDFRTAAAVVVAIALLGDEVRQAQGDPNVRLRGGGAHDDSFPAGSQDISPALRRIHEAAATLPATDASWLRDATGARSEYVGANAAVIVTAAREAGLPPDLLAGIACMEVAGKPYVFDDAIDALRRLAETGASPIDARELPDRFGGTPDSTSFGQMSVQVRRAAEALGYDPLTLSDGQRDQIITALQDPTQNMFIAAKYLENLKAESGFADVPADQLTEGQYRELAARYNGGPLWQGEDAQRYARGVMSMLDEARAALR